MQLLNTCHSGIRSILLTATEIVYGNILYSGLIWNQAHLFILIKFNMNTFLVKYDFIEFGCYLTALDFIKFTVVQPHVVD